MKLFNDSFVVCLFVSNCAENVKVKSPPKADQATSNNKATNKEAAGNNNIAAQTFSFRELATATRNFRHECLVGEGGFGRVYKGRLEKTGQVKK